MGKLWTEHARHAKGSALPLFIEKLFFRENFSIKEKYLLL
jgi:hypothetical protein